MCKTGGRIKQAVKSVKNWMVRHSAAKQGATVKRNIRKMAKQQGY